MTDVESESEVAQSCPTLCDPMDCSLPGSSLHGILQATVLEWVATSSSRGSSQPRGRTQVSRIVGKLFAFRATRESPKPGLKSGGGFGLDTGSGTTVPPGRLPVPRAAFDASAHEEGDEEGEDEAGKRQVGGHPNTGLSSGCPGSLALPALLIGKPVHSAHLAEL